MTKTRTESDTFGSIEVPADRLWGAQTERSRRNFRIGEERMPKPIIRALGLIKHAAAEINHRLGPLDKKRAQAIARAACEVMDGELDVGVADRVRHSLRVAPAPSSLQKIRLSSDGANPLNGSQ